MNLRYAQNKNNISDKQNRQHTSKYTRGRIFVPFKCKLYGYPTKQPRCKKKQRHITALCAYVRYNA